MAHCPPEKLQDIEDVLEKIRSLEKLKEKGVGIFYLKSKPFLHFHFKDDHRYAHVKKGSQWEEVPLNKKSDKAQFTKTVLSLHKLALES